MIYPYSVSPYIQNAMAQAVQAIMSGGPLPTNCFVTTIPVQQAHQMFPQMMMNYGIGANTYMYNPQAAYYGQLYQPQINQYPYNPLPPPPPLAPVPNTLVPYTNYPPQVYNQNYNYPIVPYDYSNNQGSSKKHRHGKRDPNIPHPNVYNSSSFDSDMRDLSWSRLFGNRHHHRRQSKQQSSNQTAISYNSKGKQPNDSSDTFTTSSSSNSGSSSTTSDETIRRVNVVRNQPTAPSTASKQQTKGSLPFKYSSEFVPGNSKHQQKSQKSNRKETKVRSDDVFVIKKP